MSEKKKWTLKELQTLPLELNTSRDMVFKKKKIQWVAIRKDSADGVGSYIVRAFKRMNEHFEEVDVKEAAKRMAKYLARSVRSKTILREVMIKMDVANFCDLMERVERGAKVTVGIQKGSCVYLYVRGKQGRKLPIQITE